MEHQNHQYDISHYVGGKLRVYCYSCQREFTEKERDEIIKNLQQTYGVNTKVSVL